MRFLRWSPVLLLMTCLHAQYAPPPRLQLQVAADGNGWGTVANAQGWFSLRVNSGADPSGTWYTPIGEASIPEGEGIGYYGMPDALEGMKSVATTPFGTFVTPYGGIAAEYVNYPPLACLPTLAGDFLNRALAFPWPGPIDPVTTVGEPLWLSTTPQNFCRYSSWWDVSTKQLWTDLLFQGGLQSDIAEFNVAGAVQAWIWKKVSSISAPQGGFAGSPPDFFSSPQWAFIEKQIDQDHVILSFQGIGVRDAMVTQATTPPYAATPPGLPNHPTLRPKFTVSDPITVTYVGSGSGVIIRPYRPAQPVLLDQPAKAGSNVIMNAPGWRSHMRVILVELGANNLPTTITHNLLTHWSSFGKWRFRMPNLPIGTRLRMTATSYFNSATGQYSPPVPTVHGQPTFIIVP